MVIRAKDFNRTIGMFVVAGLRVGFFLSFIFVRETNQVKSNSENHEFKTTIDAQPSGKISACNLFDIGKALEDDKFTSHSFGTLYCELLNPIRTGLNRKIRMLEIGFGCGHHNHGVSARVWKQFFSPSNGPGLALYEVDYGPHPPHEACVREFKKKYPSIVEEVYLVSRKDSFTRSIYT
jgi:hypothetical protein